MPEIEQKVTLYDLSATLMDALNSIAELESNGEPLSIEEQEALLHVIETEMRGKTDRMCQFVRHLESQVLLAGEEIKRLTARKRMFEGHVTRLESYAQRVLVDVLHTQKIEGETNTIQLRKLPDTVSLLNHALISNKYRLEIPASFSYDLNAIKAAMKAGKVIDGAMLITDRTKVVFK